MPQPTIHAGCCVDLITLIFMSKASATCILHYFSYKHMNFANINMNQHTISASRPAD